MDSWSNLCRCCLSPDSEVSLLDEENYVKQKFLEITNIEIEPDDGLPQKLCNDCYSIMSSAYQFRKQCIKMNSELKIQLDAILQQSKEVNEDMERQENEGENETSNGSENEDFANNPLKQLEAIIKQEPNDSDDDFYYVLVIDDPKDKQEYSEPNQETVVKVKQEIDESNQSLPVLQINNDQPSADAFPNSYDSFMLSNNKVPVNVPATILENEEESHENEESYLDNEMDIQETQDSTSPEQNVIIMANDDTHDEIITEDLNEGYTRFQNKNNIINILSASGTDGTIILNGTDGIQYLTTDSQLVTTNEDGGALNQEEVILCEGDESSQFQILKCDGSELVIEYTGDGDQIATILQQEDGTFLCDCGEAFEDLEEYEKHQYKHNPAGEHLCNLCGKGFESTEILTGHMVLHSSTGALVACPFCQQLIKRNAVTQHIKYCHNNIKPQCNLCFKTFANPNNLKRHMMIHTGIREFECDICFKRFHQKITMQTHRLTHLNPFACNLCDQTFESQNELQNHKKSQECSKSKIKKVKEELMKTVKQEITTDLGKLVGYACSLCKKMFSLESALEQHVESTHILDPSELLCAECGDVLPTKKDLQTHILTHKNYKFKNTKRFECKVCGKGFSSQAMLIMHERVHTNERPFPCGLCSLRFKTKTHLRTHQLTHTREKKFGCSVCMKFFALKGNLVVHLRTHTGERPYTCSICEESFIDSKYLKKHKLKKHAIENVPWNQY